MKRARNSTDSFVNDIVHGIIKLPEYIKEIIDTPQFQRLRHIRQLGFGYLVYPTAGYSRFEHSIGTFHLASELIKQLKSQINKEKVDMISDDEVKCVEIAALCHDLGHGPFSHVWEHAFDSQTIQPRKHEDLSVEIFLRLLYHKKTGEIKNIKEKIKLNTEMINFIEKLILGTYNKDEEKMFFFEIVANKTSGLDVDKFDYLCRDSIYLGWSNKNKIHDIKRILHLLRIAKKSDTGKWHLAMRDREIFHIHDVFYYRHLLHRYAYQHKTVKVIECMFKAALNDIVKNEDARNELIETVIGPKVYDPKIWFSSDFISKVCDYHIWNIMSKYTSGIVEKIQERKLYKIFDQIQIKLDPKFQGQNGHIDLQEIKSKLKDFSIKSVCSSFSVGSENKGNPLLSVNFYSKENPSECFNYTDDNLPDLVKLVENETVLTILTETEPGEETKEKLKTLMDNLINRKIASLREKYIFKKMLY